MTQEKSSDEIILDRLRERATRLRQEYEVADKAPDGFIVQREAADKAFHAWHQEQVKAAVALREYLHRNLRYEQMVSVTVRGNDDGWMAYTISLMPPLTGHLLPWAEAPAIFIRLDSDGSLSCVPCSGGERTGLLDFVRSFAQSLGWPP
jgi:hypothetical protein